jgi:probable rRNA maturation factor
MSLAIDITFEDDAWMALPGLETLVAEASAAALAEADVAVGAGTELSVVLCDDAFIRVLNRDWRAKDRPTNVLSFPADPASRALTLGDIVIAYETTVREAEAEAKPFRDHLSHLIVHGVLHLLGFDHEDDAEAEAMERREIAALRRLGISSPYEDVATLRAE